MHNDPEFDRLIAEGLAASQAGDTPLALERFAQAAAAAPASGVPHFLAASEHAAAGDIDAAEAAFARSLLLAPDFALARYQLGLLQFSSQRPTQALLTWQPLFSLPPADPLGHFVRGFAALAQDSFDQALHHYREGLACNDINQALAGDIQRVMEAVERLPGDAPPAPGSPDAPGHVLLSGYVRGGVH